MRLALKCDKSCSMGHSRPPRSAGEHVSDAYNISEGGSVAEKAVAAALLCGFVVAFRGPGLRAAFSLRHVELYAKVMTGLAMVMAGRELLTECGGCLQLLTAAARVRAVPFAALRRRAGPHRNRLHRSGGLGDPCDAVLLTPSRSLTRRRTELHAHVCVCVCVCMCTCTCTW